MVSIGIIEGTAIHQVAETTGVTYDFVGGPEMHNFQTDHMNRGPVSQIRMRSNMNAVAERLMEK